LDNKPIEPRRSELPPPGTVHDNQRQVFNVFAEHAMPGAILMFNSGPMHGEGIETYRGDPLYHASLAPDEYRDIIRVGFRLIEYIANDRELEDARRGFVELTAANLGTSDMSDMTTVEAKAFVPSRDFEQSKKFYQDLGFDLVGLMTILAHFRHGNSSFLLQNFYNEEHARNVMMHLLVEDVEA
jgi:hypothetical protein